MCQFVAVPHEAKAGDIGDGVNSRAEFAGGGGGVTIESQHALDARAGITLISPPLFDRRRYRPGAEWLRQNENIAWPCAAFGEDTIRVNDAGDGHPVLRLFIAHGVAAGNDCTGLTHLLCAAAQHLGQHFGWHIVGPGSEVNRKQRITAHRIHIREGIGRRNRAELVRIIHHGRKEVGSRYDGL